MNQEKLDLPEIYDIWRTSFFQTNIGIFFIVLITLASLALAFLIFKIVFKKKKIPYWIKADNELKELLIDSEKNLYDSNKIYVKLTGILKNYIQNRYEFFKFGITDFELVEYVKMKELEKNLVNIILTISENAQEAKFAHVNIMKNKIESDIQNSIKFINLTMPKDLKKDK